MQRIIPVLIFIFSFTYSNNLIAQNCIEIESILVDACDGGNSPEGLNEMFRFRVNFNPINISDIQLPNGWPSIEVNPQLTFNGFVQNSLTQAKTVELNGTITGCGFLIEPVNGIIPANSKVVAITSYEVDVSLNSFANLTDTIYVIYHQHNGQAGGHFLNHSNLTPQDQSLRIQINGPNPCIEAVTYQRASLVDVNGVNQPQNGATVRFTDDGIASYSNTGCLAPFNPFSADWTNPGVFCESSPPLDLNTLITGTPGGTFSGPGVTGSIFNPSGLNGNIDITYTVQPTNSCQNEPSSVTHTISVSASVDASFTNPGNICGSGGTFDLNTLITGTPGGSWSGVGVTGSILNISGNVGPVNVTYIVGIGNCLDIESQILNIINLSTPIITGTTVYCSGTNVESLIAQGDSGSTINWYANAELSQLIATGNSFLPAAGINATYYVNQTLNDCVSDSVAVILEFSTIEIPQGDTLVEYCNGEPLPIVEVSSSFSIINWYSEENLQNIVGNGLTFQVTNPTDTLYVTSISGNCESLPLIIVIAESFPVTAQITSNNGTSLCSGAPIELVSANDVNNEWNTGEIGQSITVTTAGTYTLTREGLCNTATDQIVITGLPISTEIVTDVDSGYTTLAVSVDAISINSESCIWYQDTVVIDFTSPGIISYPDSGIYELKLICTNSTGCADTAYKTIKVKSDKLLLVIPNVFSPNGDSFNELFKVKHNAVKTFSAQVFSRWGKPLFNWTDIDSGWDGTLNGEKLGDGTYFYVISGTDIKGQEFVEKGTVLLIGN
jgi:gliding motility-associated-like protein